MDWLNNFLSGLGLGAGAPIGGPGAPGYNPAVGAAMINNPQAIASAATAAGVPPPPLNNASGVDEAGFGGFLDPQQAPQMANAAAPTTPTAASAPTPPAPATAAATPASLLGSTPLSRVANTLRGVQAPPSPAVQSIHTPGIPGPGKIDSGTLLALLNSISQPQTGMKLPSTLGAALGGRYG